MEGEKELSMRTPRSLKAFATCIFTVGTQTDFQLKKQEASLKIPMFFLCRGKMALQTSQKACQLAFIKLSKSDQQPYKKCQSR